MKRNRLIRQANHIKLVSDTTVMFTKHRYIGGLVVLFTIGFFLFSPSSPDTQNNTPRSLVIDLPGIAIKNTSASYPPSLTDSPNFTKPFAPSSNSTLVKKVNTIATPNQKISKV